MSPGTADYLGDAVAQAGEGPCLLLVIVDTPGGLLQSTHAIVRSFLASPAPIAVWVGPAGARAGSAGVFVTMAAHVAAMAPGTRIGAAHPVLGMGGEADEEQTRKVTSDTAAFARSVAAQRGRNAEWAEAAVRESASATAEEAVELGVVDAIAPGEAELLRMLDGRTMELVAGPAVLRVAGAEVRSARMTLRQQVLAALGNPELAYFLMMLGLLGVLIEVSNPGLVVPGAVGGVSLLLAAIGMNILPVNVGAVLLLLLAAGLLVAEVFVTSYGLLTGGGVILLLLGASLLIDRTDPDLFADADFAVSWGLVLPLAAVLAGAAALLAWKAGRARRAQSPTGAEGLVGEHGVAASAVSPEGGWVRVHGERWQAVADAPVEPGRPVRVLRAEGLHLVVEPLGSGGA